MMMTTIITILIRKWKYVLLVVLSLAIYTLFSMYSTQKAEAIRANSNVKVLNSNFKSYKISYKRLKGKTDTIITQNAAQIGSLTYTVGEFERFRGEDAQTIDALNLKLKNVQSVTNIGTQTNTTINTKIQYIDSTKCLNYADKYTTLSGCFRGDSIGIKVVTTDSLTTVVSRIPKHRFLWWSWGVKSVKVDITSQNPNTTFTYLKYVELKK